MKRTLPVLDATYAAGKIFGILPPTGQNCSTRVLVECAHCPEQRRFECAFPALRNGTQKSCGCLKRAAFLTYSEGAVDRLSPNERLLLFMLRGLLHDSAQVVARPEVAAIRKVQINRYVVDFAWRSELTHLKALPAHRLQSISRMWEDQGSQRTALFHGLSKARPTGFTEYGASVPTGQTSNYTIRPPPQ